MFKVHPTSVHHSFGLRHPTCIRKGSTPLTLSTADIKHFFSDNCLRYVRHCLSVGAFWNHKIHRIVTHGNGGRRTTGNGARLVNWKVGKRRAWVHWKWRALYVMLVDVDVKSIITARRFHCPITEHFLRHRRRESHTNLVAK